MSMLALALPVILKINNYVIKIENNTLKNIETTEVSSELNLSNLGLRDLDSDVFSNMTNLQSLDLANNCLQSLPEFVFDNLENLTYLSLASNNISRFNNVFNRLRSLKTLNITNNPQQRYWDYPIFAGLNASCKIWTRGTFPKFLMASSFHNFSRGSAFSSGKPEELIRWYAIGNTYSIWNIKKDYRVCIPGGVVETLQEPPSFPIPVPGCSWAEISDLDNQKQGFNLSNLGIARFESSWYRVQNFRMSSIDISFNNVQSVSSEILNDLPSTIVNVNLAWNKIERLLKGVIDNRWLELLDFSNNFISFIENDTFKKSNVSTLILSGNRLTNIDFVTSLAISIVSLHLNCNKIELIADRSFRKIGNLVYLDLSENSIMELKSLSLNGLSRLKTLILHENRLRKIEPGAFHDLRSLTDLDMCCNSIAIIEKGVFVGLTNIRMINLTGNKLTKIGKEFLFGILNTLKTLLLDFNAIEVVEAGSFVRGPKELLSMGNNKISKIEKGTFGVPSSERDKWSLNRTITGFDQLFYPSEILSGLRALWIFNNKIERLENGALFGMEKSKHTEVNFRGVNIELIQPGVFDDL